MDGVEKARARVRELTPLFFTFDLPIMSSLDAVLDPNDAFLRAIQDQYNIQVCSLFKWLSISRIVQGDRLEVFKNKMDSKLCAKENGGHFVHINYYYYDF